MKRFKYRLLRGATQLRKKTIVIGLLFTLILGIGGYNIFRNAEADIKTLYPKSPESFVGDPMPYYNGKKFMMYYLEDLRDGQIGFHPFSLLETTDFYNYKDYGEVIPFVNEEDSIERALGTGSVFKDKGGLYHAFYTGHNQKRNPKEVIMHATSKDGITFDKIQEDTFEGDEMYEKDDFRDPFVFWEEESQMYWMLITTRKDGQGVIAKYTSVDLKNWENNGVFFENDLGNDSNLECPSLVQYKGKWYLAFSDQWDQRVVHYRISNDVNGTFKAPEEGLDYIDGSGFYAGRLVTNGEELYMVGWIPTKDQYKDIFKYNWAGNLAVHQLHAENDKLIPDLPQSAYEIVNKSSFPTENISSNEIYKFSIEDNNILEGKIAITQPNTKVALQFSNSNNIILDFKEQMMYYFNVDLERLSQRDPITEIPLITSEDEIDIKIVIENDIIVIYANDAAFSNRIYDINGETFDLKVITGGIQLIGDSK